MIRFGTSGWRAVIGDEFTFENVRRLTRAIARVVAGDAGDGSAMAVAGDTRFLSQEFAAAAAEVLVAEGVAAQVCPDPVPTPVLAHAILHGGLAGGINVTASHNPPEYSGMKFSTSDGAPAPPEITRRVEAALPECSGDLPSGEDGVPGELQPRDAYLEQIARLVKLDIIGGMKTPVTFDSRFGTTRGYLDALLESAGIPVHRLHDWRDPLFGGGTPDCSGKELGDLRQQVILDGSLGLATDGDGDRFGVVDTDGTEVVPNLVLALLADYLCRSRGWAEGIGRSVATTHLLDRVAEHHGFPVHETPVGFKYFNPLLASGQIFMGCEESAGMSVKGHVPEKDGILANLLLVEMLAEEGPDVRTQAERLYRIVGRVLSRRLDRRFAPEKREQLARRTASPPDRLAGVAVAREVTLDGRKWIREDGAWLLIRISGTEPVVRLYAEAEDEKTLEELLAAGAGLLPE